MSYAPIVLFVYKRPEHTQKTIEALIENEQAKFSDLFIFSDGAKSKKDETAVKEVRQVIQKISGFNSVTVFENEINIGLANSIINGVTKIVNDFGRIIVLEDDLVTSRFFLKYMNDGLELYKNEDKVICVHGYTYPVKEKLLETFFLKGADCWGWATWKRGWNLFESDSKKLLKELQDKNLEYEFDFNGTINNVRMLKKQIRGKVDSWAIRWHASAFLKDKYTLYPGRSLVNNIGIGDKATHTRGINIYNVNLSKTPILIDNQKVIQNDAAHEAFQKFFTRQRNHILNNLIEKIKKTIRKSFIFS